MLKCRGYDYTRFAIRAGSSLVSSGGQYIAVGTVVMHPDYAEYSLTNDIVILKLVSSLFFNMYVQAIRLPPQGLQIAEGELASIAGWGKLNVS